MASKLIHYLIGKKVLQNIKVKDANRFIIGTLCPDASSHEDESYNKAHFWVKKEEDLKVKGINWRIFEEKYKERILKDELYLGYYCHLIMDSFWFFSMVDSHVRIHWAEKDKYYTMGYRDYSRFNYILSKEYDLKYDIKIIDNIDIKEVNYDILNERFSELEDEIEKCEEAKVSELELYSYDDMVSFINDCVELCINEINALKGIGQHKNPEDYYAPIHR